MLSSYYAAAAAKCINVSILRYDPLSKNASKLGQDFKKELKKKNLANEILKILSVNSSLRQQKNNWIEKDEFR